LREREREREEKETLKHISTNHTKLVFMKNGGKKWRKKTSIFRIDLDRESA
jgi:hypothetical protein